MAGANKFALRANLTAALVKEIEDDHKMPEFCKKIFKKCIPRLIAKALNASGVSAEHSDGGFVALAVVFYLYKKITNGKRLADLLKKAGLAPEPQPEGKKSNE